MSVTFTPGTAGAWNMISVDYGPAHVVLQYNTDLRAWQLTDFSPNGSELVSATTYSTIALALAAAEAIVAAYTTAGLENDELDFVEFRFGPEYARGSWDGSKWQLADLGPGGTGIPAGSYSLAQLFAAAAALM